MTVCPNCKSNLSCSCKLKTASDGKQVCSNCIASYEGALKTVKK